ncbi:SRPBCC family protein [Ferroplasma acidarmanus]|jgi:carbon monoxide dehydrogenase subunit G|uniref:CoxG protein n=1 Tax=Ferroplasma acidarmanus Fer1 TaxID=333146 RepID=S0ALT7_FERAC|nr:carbon monoxide dehydrogenase subunit G [Ferroplasma acidarmanus]AGO60268.1 CoxG protein [Ferroplasma acidarmanus Fer1]
MLTFEDSFDVKTTPEKAYGYVVDQEALIKLIPDLLNYEKVDENEMKLTAKAGVSFIKGKFDLVLDITDKKASEHITLKGKGNGSGASVDFTVNFDFLPDEDGTKVNWKADMNIVGTAASMGARMLKSAAQKYIVKLVGNYKKALEEDAGN